MGPNNTGWATASSAPPPRFEFGMAAIGSSLFIFGGHNGSVLLGDFWKFDCSAGTYFRNTRNSSPSPRSGHGVASLSGKLYVFGGRNQTGASKFFFPMCEKDVSLKGC